MNLADFNKLLARVLERNMPLPESLACVAQATRSTRLRRAIQQVRAGVLEGKSLDVAMEAHPRIFPETYRAVVRAGLASGKLAEILSFGCIWDEAKASMRRITLPILGYAAALVLGVCCILLSLHDTGRSFAEMFQELGLPLPLSTRISLALLEHIHIALLTVMLVPIILYVVWRLLFLTSVTGRIIYSIPVIGKAIKAASLARFCALSAALLETGQPVTETIRLCAAAERNRYFRNVLKNAENSVGEGQGLAEVESLRTFFPRTFAWMTLVGHRRGNLPGALRNVAHLCVRQVRGLAVPFSYAIAMVLFIPVNCLVVFIATSLYAPLLFIMRVI